MNHQHAVEVLVEIERRADVNAVRAGGLGLWPLVRLGFWEQLLQPDRKAPATVAKAPLRFPPWSALMRTRERLRLRALPQASALFLSRHEDHGDRFAAGLYNRHVDPLLAFCRPRLSCLKIEPDATNAAPAFPRAEATTLVRPDRLAAMPGPPALEGVESLRAALAEIGEPLHFEEAAVRRQVAQSLRWRAAYLEILDQVQPRVVFVVCYYDRRAMPLVAACRARGIPTVDIQHGKQGVHHGLYTHWTRLPAEGCEMVPDFFWVWGEPSRRHIASGQPETLKRHRAIVGGNRWLALWRNGAAFPPAPEEAAWLAEARKTERVILVTLQPINPVLPVHLREAIRRSPAGWLWLLRAHPHRRAEIPQLIAGLAGDSTACCEGERASTVPLYALLRIADRHLTCWSSVAQEAPAFDVPTMIVHPSGAQLYAAEIASGHFAYAESADTVLAWIAGEKPRAHSGERYIETDDEYAEAALSAVLAGAPPPWQQPG